MTIDHVSPSATVGKRPVRVPLPYMRIKPTQIDWKVLAQIALCVVPSVALLGIGRVSLGGKCFFGLLLLLLLRHGLMRDRFAFVSLVLGTVPVALYLRNNFYYNSVLVILAAGLFVWHISAPRDFTALVENARVRLFLVFAALYWGASFFITGDYSVNFRVLELAFTVANIWLLARHRQYLTTALVGFGMSAFAISLAFLSHGERLGFARIGDVQIGNAITLGSPLALLFLLSLADKGKWLGLQDRRVLRQVCNLLAGAFLALSTSRGSWLVALVGLTIMLLYQPHHRGKVMASVVIAAIALFVLVQSERGQFVKKWYDKTFSSDLSLIQKTSGRSAQWIRFPTIIQDSPLWGFGPGLGKMTNIHYSYLIDGRLSGGSPVLHSLYLHMGVETGFIGLTVLLTFLGNLIAAAVRHQRFTGEVVPLLGVLGFATISLSVNGMDAASGMYLGLGFLTSRRKTSSSSPHAPLSFKASPTHA